MSKILLEADNKTVEKQLIQLTNDLTFAKKLLALGKPFEKACKVLGYNITNENGGNPLLAFVIKQKHLVDSGAINANTFKALYNAVAKHLVADSEFFKPNDYNIIYCKNLYKKTPKEIEEYLIVQERILNPDNSVYTEDDQLSNRKTFLYIKGITNSQNKEELNIVKRAELIKALTDKNRIPKATTGVLNNIELARQINGQSKTANKAAPLHTADIDKIMAKLTTPAAKYAAILLLGTESAKAKQALTDPKFSNLDQRLVADAFMKLLKDTTIPKKPLQETDADLLIAKILVALAPNGNKQEQQSSTK